MYDILKQKKKHGKEFKNILTQKNLYFQNSISYSFLDGF
jgi:hypothetical protein